MNNPVISMFEYFHNDINKLSDFLQIIRIFLGLIIFVLVPGKCMGSLGQGWQVSSAW